jgi:outer membrane lipoprotein-sorting protein
MKSLATFSAVILACLISQAISFAKTPAPTTTQTATMDTDQVLAKMEQASKNFPSLQADVQKTQYNNAISKFKDPQTGKVWISAPPNAARRIKIDFDKPLKELFLIDKGVLTHYYPGQKTGETKPVTRDDQAEGECVLMGLCQPGPRIKQNYDIRVVGPETVDGVKTMRLSLKPKDPTHASGFALIELWLDSTKWYTVQTRVTESNKNYANYRFSNFQTGKIADSIFNIDIPKDAEISKHK